MAQLVECLPCKHEDLSLISRKKAGCGSACFNPSAVKTKAGGSLGLSGKPVLSTTGVPGQ